MTLFLGRGLPRLLFVLACGLPLPPLLSLSPALAWDVIIDATVNQQVYGNSPTPDGLTPPTAAAAAGNSVTVDSGGRAWSSIHGGYVLSSGSASASGNSVAVNSGGVLYAFAYGGYAESLFGSASASGNSALLDGGVTDWGEIYGGIAKSDGAAAAVGNTLLVKANSSVGNASVVGGLAQGMNATAAGNVVVVSGGATTTIGADVYGGYSVIKAGGAGEASGNQATVEALVIGDVYGGLVGGSGSATGNVVNLGAAADVQGDVYGGRVSQSGSAAGNAVNISGAAQARDIYGGRVNQSGGSAAGNVVNLGGAAQVQDVYGGLVEGSSSAVGNVVNLSGAAQARDIYGGRENIFSTSNVDEFSGNTLNLRNHGGSPVGSVQNFQYFSFLFPASQAGPALTATGTVHLGEIGGTRSSTVTAVNTHGAAPIPAGSGVTLIDAGTLDAAGFSQTQGPGRHGATIRYLWALAAANNRLTATALDTGAAPEAKNLSEGFLSGLAFLNQGRELVAGPGLSEAIRRGGLENWGAFAALSGGLSRYDSGSHVDVWGLSLMTGLACGRSLEPGRLTLAGFLEYGRGSYEAYSYDVRGDGALRYLGGGLAAGFEAEPKGLHAEASARAGRLNNDHKSGLTDALGRPANYDVSAAYYGAHLGGGYIFDLDEKTSLDLYGKYFWTRLKGNSVTLATDDPVAFENADSSRLRLGGRFAYAAGEGLTPYAGLAWEHEFSGEARAASYGYGIEAPSLKGHTGLAELGLALTPSAERPLSLELGVTGYAGARRGAEGHLQVKWEF